MDFNFDLLFRGFFCNYTNLLISMVVGFIYLKKEKTKKEKGIKFHGGKETWQLILNLYTV